jgi:hypothetical protein
MALDDHDFVTLSPQVVRTAKTGHASAHNNARPTHEPAPGTLAVTWSSMRIPGTAKSATTVVLAGRGG